MQQPPLNSRQQYTSLHGNRVAFHTCKFTNLWEIERNFSYETMKNDATTTGKWLLVRGGMATCRCTCGKIKIQKFLQKRPVSHLCQICITKNSRHTVLLLLLLVTIIPILVFLYGIYFDKSLSQMRQYFPNLIHSLIFIPCTRTSNLGTGTGNCACHSSWLNLYCWKDVLYLCLISKDVSGS